MVKNKFTILVIFLFCNIAITGFTQNSFLDEINLMNQQRNFQLVDSNKNLESSFLISSTQQFQSIQNYHYFKKSKKIFQLGIDNKK